MGASVRDLTMAVAIKRANHPGDMVASYREEIEERVREECAEKTASTRESNAQLILSLAERDKRIAELSDMHRSSSVKLDWLRARNTELDKRIADLESQLAAAKPVLTMCGLHREHVEECRAAVGRFAKDGERMPSLVALFADLIHVVDTLCPPPKAPPTDAELVALLHRALFDKGDQSHGFVSAAYDALRARVAAK